VLYGSDHKLIVVVVVPQRYVYEFDSPYRSKKDT
jgi:hypothetical protein